MERMVADGALRVPDIEYASWLLPNMAFGRFHVRLQLGLADQVPEDVLDRRLRLVVDDFLQWYGA